MLLHYATTPKRTVWRPELDLATWRAGGLAWTELEPTLGWKPATDAGPQPPERRVGREAGR